MPKRVSDDFVPTFLASGLHRSRPSTAQSFRSAPRPWLNNPGWATPVPQGWQPGPEAIAWARDVTIDGMALHIRRHADINAGAGSFGVRLSHKKRKALLQSWSQPEDPPARNSSNPTPRPSRPRKHPASSTLRSSPADAVYDDIYASSDDPSPAVQHHRPQRLPAPSRLRLNGRRLPRASPARRRIPPSSPAQSAAPDTPSSLRAVPETVALAAAQPAPPNQSSSSSTSSTRQIVLAHAVSRIPVAAAVPLQQTRAAEPDSSASAPQSSALALAVSVELHTSSIQRAAITTAPAQPGLTVREPGDSRKQRPARDDLPQGVRCPLVATPSQPVRLTGKGAKFASVCPGPWIDAILHMPTPIPTGRRRAALGLALVPVNNEDIVSVEQERAARALTAILPYSSAAFILSEPAAAIAARPASDVAEDVARTLSAYGASSLSQAYSALGRLLAWAVRQEPPVVHITGRSAADFLLTVPASVESILGGWSFVRDWAGVDIPSRAPVMRGPRQSAPAPSERDTKPFTLPILIGLEWLSKHHEHPMVRGHASGWFAMATHALRHEQARACVVNAFASHSSPEGTCTITSASVLRDKHPNRSKRRPRPVWGTLDGYAHPGAVREAFIAMLQACPGVRSFLLETDSPDGDPRRASQWVASPIISSNRADASIRALLSIPPISLSPEVAATYHGHSPKRFLLSAAEWCADLGGVAATEVARFSGSTAQNQDLEPIQAMLLRHELRSSILPDIYSRQARVSKVFDLIVTLHLAIQQAVSRILAHPGRYSTEHGWDAFNRV